MRKIKQNSCEHINLNQLIYESLEHLNKFWTINTVWNIFNNLEQTSQVKVFENNLWSCEQLI